MLNFVINTFFARHLSCEYLRDDEGVVASEPQRPANRSVNSIRLNRITLRFLLRIVYLSHRKNGTKTQVARHYKHNTQRPMLERMTQSVANGGKCQRGKCVPLCGIYNIQRNRRCCPSIVDVARAIGCR